MIEIRGAKTPDESTTINLYGGILIVGQHHISTRNIKTKEKCFFETKSVWVHSLIKSSLYTYMLI